MITYVAEDGKTAVPYSVTDVKTIYGVFNSWDSFLASEQPISLHEFNGVYNYPVIENFFSGWGKICRNDENWAIELCGENPVPVVPTAISARQIRLWLVANNVSLTQIATLIDGIEDLQQREFTRVEWEYAPYVERNHPMVTTFATALGLTPEQVDAGFILAATL